MRLFVCLFVCSCVSFTDKFTNISLLLLRGFNYSIRVRQWTQFSLWVVKVLARSLHNSKFGPPLSYLWNSLCLMWISLRTPSQCDVWLEVPFGVQKLSQSTACDWKYSWWSAGRGSVGSEVLKVVTMKNTVLWIVKSFSSERARRFEEHLASIFSTEA